MSPEGDSAFKTAIDRTEKAERELAEALTHKEVWSNQFKKVCEDRDSALASLAKAKEASLAAMTKERDAKHEDAFRQRAAVIRLDRESHRYYLDNGEEVPGYSQICRDLGIVKDNTFYTEQGREEGNALHLWLGFLARGKTPAGPPDPRIAGRVEGIGKFLWQTGFQIAGGEVPLYDPINRYACTPDLYGHIFGISWVLDMKRGAKLPSHRLQTAAQDTALRANGFRAQKRGALYLKDGDYRLDEHTDKSDRANWAAIVEGYHAMSPDQRAIFSQDDFDARDPSVLGMRPGKQWNKIVAAYNARSAYR